MVGESVLGDRIGELVMLVLLGGDAGRGLGSAVEALGASDASAEGVRAEADLREQLAGTQLDAGAAPSGPHASRCHVTGPPRNGSEADGTDETRAARQPVATDGNWRRAEARRQLTFTRRLRGDVQRFTEALGLSRSSRRSVTSVTSMPSAATATRAAAWSAFAHPRTGAPGG